MAKKKGKIYRILREEMLKQTIGRNIRFARLSRGLSQRELAEKVGSSQGYISALENGRFAPGSRIMTDIYASLGMKITVK